MKLSIPIIKKNEQLFFLSYIIFMIFSVLMHSFYHKYYASLYKYIVVLCIILLLLQEIVNQTLSYRAMVGALVLYVTALFLAIQGTNELQLSFACVFVFAFGARNIDFRKICRITVILTLALLLFVVLSSYLGIIENYKTIQGDRTRYFLGFKYALNAPAFLLNAILLYVYDKRDKCKFFEILFLFVLSVVLFALTDSRLSFILSIVGLLIAVICKIKKSDFSRANKLSFILIPSFLICFAVSLWFTVSYSPNVAWMRELNALLDNRLYFQNKSYMLYGVSLFGTRNIEWVGAGLDMYGRQNTESYFYVDNLYIQLLQRYGIIFMIIFLVLTTALMIQCYKKKEHLLVILLSIIALHGLVENGMIYLQMNTFWILIGPAVFGYIKSRKVEKGSVKKQLQI